MSKLLTGTVLETTHAVNTIQFLAFDVTRGDAASQDSLNGPALEPFEDLKALDKSFQPPEGE